MTPRKGSTAKPAPAADASAKPTRPRVRNWKRLVEKAGGTFAAPASSQTPFHFCGRCGRLASADHRCDASRAGLRARVLEQRDIKPEKVSLTPAADASPLEQRDVKPRNVVLSGDPSPEASEDATKPAVIARGEGLFEHGWEAISHPDCPGCMRAEAAARESRNPFMWFRCELCGAKVSAQAGPNPALDMRDLARHFADVFGRSAGEMSPIIGLGGTGASPSALSGRGDRVDEARGFGRAVTALRRMRALIQADAGTTVAIVWAAFGLVSDAVSMSLVNERIALGFAPRSLREEWRMNEDDEKHPGLRSRLAIVWGRERLAPFWEGIRPVDEFTAHDLAFGFADPWQRAEWSKTKSDRLRSTEAAAWGQVRLAAAAERYARIV